MICTAFRQMTKADIGTTKASNNSSCNVSYGPRKITHYIAVLIAFCIIRAHYYGMTTDEILPILAERVKQLRKKWRFSQPEIARRAGMSLRSYQAFEATGNIALKKLANVLVVLEMEGELARFLAAPKPTFKSLDDFGPGAIAKNVPALAKLYEARQQLNDLMVYMDGKDGAQGLLDKVLKDPELLKSLAAAKPAEGEGASE